MSSRKENKMSQWVYTQSKELPKEVVEQVEPSIEFSARNVLRTAYLILILPRVKYEIAKKGRAHLTTYL